MISASANTVMMWDGKPILLDRFLGRLPSRPDLDECRRDHYLTQE